MPIEEMVVTGTKLMEHLTAFFHAAAFAVLAFGMFAFALFHVGREVTRFVQELRRPVGRNRHADDRSVQEITPAAVLPPASPIPERELREAS